ncbi:GNAT family N-acetyltransferase [Ferruginibacter sp.]
MNATLKDDFIISTDPSMIDINAVHDYLCNESYWAKDISLQLVQRAIAGSFCFAVFKKEDNDQLCQVGFARVITDKATFGYLADVFILPAYRGRGLSKWLMEEITTHPDLATLKGWMLSTRDAHGLYEQFGFNRVQSSERLMRRNTTATNAAVQ